MRCMKDDVKTRALSKVPEVTLLFWIIKIAATTLGETGGDAVTMTLNWGYLLGTLLFAGLLIALVIARPILPIVRSASATRVDRWSCSVS
jgi:uncharacterized membrane-anchored protein